MSNSGFNFDENLAHATEQKRAAKSTQKLTNKAFGISSSDVNFGPNTGIWNDQHLDPMPSYHHQKARDDSLQAIQNHLSDPGFADFVKDSYDSQAGYSIRINPDTGKKEMMIAGTRTMGQWGLNAVDAVGYGIDKALKKGTNKLIEISQVNEIPFVDLHVKGIHLFEHLDPYRKKKEAYFSEVAKQNDVDIIYGHSRGGAMLADMKVQPDVQKVGLDAAMLIAHDTGMLNINEGGGTNPLGLFDELIGLTGEKNEHFDASVWSPHKVWAT